MISDSKLYALWCPKDAQKEVFGEPFRSDFELSGESENERMKPPCAREHCFRGFRPSKKRWISTLFSEGVRGSSGVAFLYAFNDFGCPPGFKKETILELASAFIALRDSDDFRGV